MKVREKAFELLKDIILGKQYSNLVLRKQLKDENDIDRRFITNLVYGTMQNYLYVRYQWERFVNKKLPGDVEILLDMSIYQLIFMDKTPAYAIVNEAVEISEIIKRGSYKSLVNAVLRRFQREGLRELPRDEIKRLSIETSHEEWLVRMWVSQYGYDTAQKICHENQKTPLNACRVNTLLTTSGELLENEQFEKGKLCPDALIYKGGNIADTKEFLSGKVTIQDESSQCVALFLNPQPKERILDVCAAPATKTTHIAELMKDQGEIIACDLHAHRVELMENSIKRLNLHCIHTRQLDAEYAHEAFECASFDRILVDAPCSGYGVLKRKNDIKVHMESNDMDEIILVQRKILESVASLLKKTGSLVYSTCTLNKKENEKQIEYFLKNHPEYECVEMKTIFPFEYESDGFFMAKLMYRR